MNVDRAFVWCGCTVLCRMASPRRPCWLVFLGLPRKAQALLCITPLPRYLLLYSVSLFNLKSIVKEYETTSPVYEPLWRNLCADGFIQLSQPTEREPAYRTIPIWPGGSGDSVGAESRDGIVWGRETACESRRNIPQADYVKPTPWYRFCSGKGSAAQQRNAAPCKLRWDLAQGSATGEASRNSCL